jgi:cellulose synthase/poly-beta-1,6-N-acetylglucosamine synthase-like glycosyltransferase
MMSDGQTIWVLAVVFCVAALAHAYVGYPASLWLWRRLKKSRPVIPAEPDNWPRLALIVSAYNEEAGIADKIRNFFELDYPPEKLMLYLGDDCSGDRTVEIARQAIGESPRVRLIARKRRSGKAATVNDLAAQADAEILVMSDATSLHEPASFKRLARWLGDPDIGVAGASLTYVRPDGGPDTGEGLYWKLEMFMRGAESDLGSAMQPSGACYALRKDDFTPLPPDAMCDDFHLPLSVAARGKRIVIDEHAQVSEWLAPDQGAEFRRRVRIGSGNFQILWRFAYLLWPGYGRLWYMYLSHKVLRWLGPLWMLGSLLGCLPLLSFGMAAGWFSIQCTGYALALAAWKFEKLRSASRVLNLMVYFCAINAALALGAIKLATARPSGQWEKA